ncbi:MAG: hypothetical protein RIT81_30420 [Deltaproteobacteria bacterium]
MRTIPRDHFIASLARGVETERLEGDLARTATAIDDGDGVLTSDELSRMYDAFEHAGAERVWRALHEARRNIAPTRRNTLRDAARRAQRAVTAAHNAEVASHEGLLSPRSAASALSSPDERRRARRDYQDAALRLQRAASDARSTPEQLDAAHADFAAAEGRFLAAETSVGLARDRANYLTWARVAPKESGRMIQRTSTKTADAATLAAHAHLPAGAAQAVGTAAQILGDAGREAGGVVDGIGTGVLNQVDGAAQLIAAPVEVAEAVASVAVELVDSESFGEAATEIGSAVFAEPLEAFRDGEYGRAVGILVGEGAVPGHLLSRLGGRGAKAAAVTDAAGRATKHIDGVIARAERRLTEAGVRFRRVEPEGALQILPEGDHPFNRLARRLAPDPHELRGGRAHAATELVFDPHGAGDAAAMFQSRSDGFDRLGLSVDDVMSGRISPTGVHELRHQLGRLYERGGGKAAKAWRDGARPPRARVVFRSDDATAVPENLSRPATLVLDDANRVGSYVKAHNVDEAIAYANQMRAAAMNGRAALRRLVEKADRHDELLQVKELLQETGRNTSRLERQIVALEKQMAPLKAEVAKSVEYTANTAAYTEAFAATGGGVLKRIEDALPNAKVDAVGREVHLQLPRSDGGPALTLRVPMPDRDLWHSMFPKEQRRYIVGVLTSMQADLRKVGRQARRVNDALANVSPGWAFNPYRSAKAIEAYFGKARRRVTR